MTIKERHGEGGGKKTASIEKIRYLSSAPRRFAYNSAAVGDRAAITSDLGDSKSRDREPDLNDIPDESPAEIDRDLRRVRSPS